MDTGKKGYCDACGSWSEDRARVEFMGAIEYHCKECRYRLV